MVVDVMDADMQNEVTDMVSVCVCVCARAA